MGGSPLAFLSIHKQHGGSSKKQTDPWQALSCKGDEGRATEVAQSPCAGSPATSDRRSDAVCAGHLGRGLSFSSQFREKPQI